MEIAVYNLNNKSCGDLVHSVGLPAKILKLIPNAQKRDESPNVKHEDEGKGIGYLADWTWSSTKYWIGKAVDFIVDLAEKMAEWGMKWVRSLI